MNLKRNVRNKSKLLSRSSFTKTCAYFILIFLSVIVFSSFGNAAECGVIPTAGCQVSTSTTFNTGNYNLNGTIAGAIQINASNVVLDCNNSYIYGNTTSVNQIRGIFAQSLGNITIKNCRIENYERPINIRLSPTLIIDNVTTNLSEFSFNLEGNDNTTINNSKFYSSERYPLFFYAGSNGTIYNSLFSNNMKILGNVNTQQVFVENANISMVNVNFTNFGGNIINATNSSVGIHNSTFTNINGSVTGTYSTFIILSSNFSNFTSKQPASLGISGYEDIYLVNCTNNIIRFNVFNYTLTEEAIYFNSSSGLIDSNYISDTNRHGIAVRNSNQVNVTNNYINNAGWHQLLGGYAIDIFGSGSNILVNNNYVTNSFDCDIFSMDPNGTNLTSINNTCNNVDDYGVYFRSLTNAISIGDIVNNATLRALSSIGDTIRNNNVTFINTSINNQEAPSFVITLTDNITFNNIVSNQSLYFGRVDAYSTQVNFTNVASYRFYFGNATNLAFNISSTNNYLYFSNNNDTLNNNIDVYNIQDYLLYWDNGSTKCQNITSCDGDINFNIRPRNFSFILRNFNLTENANRQFNPVWFHLSSSVSKTILSNLTNSITTGVIVSTPSNCASISKITWQQAGGNLTTWLSPTANLVCTNLTTIGQQLIIDPTGGGSDNLLTFFSDNGDVALLNLCSSVTSGFDGFFGSVMTIFSVLALLIILGFLFIVFQATSGDTKEFDYTAFDGIKATLDSKLVMISILGIAVFAWLIIVIFGVLCAV